jgi:hypothetical protein
VILEFGGATEILFSLRGVALANLMLVGLLALTSSRLGSKRRPVFGDAVDENQWTWRRMSLAPLVRSLDLLERGNQEYACANPSLDRKDRSPDGSIPQPLYEVLLGLGEPWILRR